MASVVICLGLMVALVYIAWPRPRLVGRRGSIYQRKFDDFFTVAWGIWVFSVNVTYVRIGDNYYVSDSNNISWASVTRLATTFEAKRIEHLLYEDLKTMLVVRTMDDCCITVVTKSGAQFDLELDDDQWCFRHNGETVPDPNQVYRELRMFLSANIITRSNRSES